MIRFGLVTLMLILVGIYPAVSQSEKTASIPPAALIQPEELVASLKSGETPAILQVGYKVMFEEAHIPGAVYVGPASKPEGIDGLKKAAQSLDKSKTLVIYCGCCPWETCPNIAVAWRTLTELGFSKLKVLYLPKNFGTDWVEKGYPVVRA